MAALEERVKGVYFILDDLADEVGDKKFEITCLGVPNTKSRLDLQIAMLKVNIYQELFNASGTKEHEKLQDKANKNKKS